MEVMSELNDLQMKHAELLAQNLILTKQIAELKSENESLMAQLVTLLGDESESESEYEESESDSTE